MRQSAGGKSGRRAGIQMEKNGEAEHDEEAGHADAKRHADLRQGSQAEGGEELGSGAVADREDEQAEEDRSKQWRNGEISELPEDDGDDQDAGRRTQRKSLEPDAA